MKLIVLSEAALDVANAALWYDNAQLGLGDRFLEEVSRAYLRLESDRPFITAPFRRYRKRVIRRVFLRYFPYPRCRTASGSVSWKLPSSCGAHSS